MELHRYRVSRFSTFVPMHRIFSSPVRFAGFLCLTAGLLLSGCKPLDSLLGNKSGPDVQVRLVNAFAIVDLDEIARRLGRDDALRQALQLRQNQLSGNLTQVRDQYLEQARSLQKQLGDKPSAEDQKKLTDAVNQMNAKLSDLRQQAAANLSQEQVNLVQKFRSEIRPFAVGIARERGFATILIKNENLIFAYDPSSDITEEVVKRMGTPVVP